MDGDGFSRCLLLIFSLICIFSSTGHGKKCFNCYSLIEPRCGRPFSPLPRFIVDCPSHFNCRKLIYGNEVTRNCSGSDGQPLETSSGHHNGENCFEKLIKMSDTIPFVGVRTESRLVTICNCDEELCNSGSVPRLSLFSFTLLVFSVTVIVYNVGKD